MGDLNSIDADELELLTGCKLQWVEEAKKTVKVDNEVDLKIDRFNSSSITKMTLATWLGGARDIMTRQANMIARMQKIIEQQKTESLSDKKDIIKLQSDLISSKDYQLLSIQSAVQNTVQSTVQREVKLYSAAVSKNISSTAPVLSPDSVKQAVKSAIAEEDRGKNIMVFGLGEENNEQLEEKMSEVFQELGEKPTLVASRVGRVSEASSSKSRPVKVVLSSSVNVDHILAKSGKLKQTQRFKTVYLRPDMSPEEREVRRTLVSDLRKAIASEPGRYHFIQGGAVISRDKVGT